MTHFSRLVLAAVATGVMATALTAQPLRDVYVIPLIHSSSQGYLGVALQDIDTARASALNLKGPGGAEIIAIDRDAPAGKAGLQLHDVVLEMNGTQINSVGQLRHMLRETPAGQTITLVISREGESQTLSVQLADESQIEQQAWSQHFSVPNPAPASGPEGFLSSSTAHLGSLFSALTPGSLYIGVEVDTLNPQLAEYFGVKGNKGLLVKAVDDNSPASTAGLKAGDVIIRVNNDAVASRSDWLKQLHANRGKQVQLVVVRNRHEQTLNLLAGEPKKRGALELPDFFPDADPVIEAELQTMDEMLSTMQSRESYPVDQFSFSN
ncbi:MAG: PDZ domain-containing protein [Acidobacteria bacterium]|nr:PDZ domain-containing protein [Acidobacteriota bacterium]